MLPADFDMERVQGHLQVLVQEIGPRPWKSAEEARAAVYVEEQLTDAGWSPRFVRRAANQVACRGSGRRVLLAHIDTVPGSPGAVDNAAAVALLLELARTTAARDLCVAFTDGEEYGLHGAHALTAELAAWHPQPDALELAVSTEWLGQGEVSIMGLGAAWGDQRLGWLADALDPVPDAPFPYRLYSRLLPTGERSDHGAFANDLGLPALLLLGRGDGGIFPRYHQPDDTATDADALAAAAVALDALATAPPLPAAGSTRDASTLFAGRVWPTWLSWLLMLGGALSGAWDLRRARELPSQLLRLAPAVGAAALVMVPFVAWSWFSPTLPEQTAANTVEMPSTGWWRGAWPAVLCGLGALLAVRRLLRPRGSAPLAAAILMAAFSWVDPLLGAVFGATALLARLHPLFGLLPALYLMQPAILREFGFHGLISPALWGLGWVLAWPALGRYPRPRFPDSSTRRRTDA